MKVFVEDAGPCRKKIRVEVPAETVAAEYQKLLASFVGQASVPGFRTGRAPKEVVERRFQKALAQELRDALLPRFYHDALKAEKLDPLAILDLEEPVVKKGEPMTFTVTLDVAPQFELPTYKGIPLDNKQKAVSDEEIQRAIEDLRQQYAKYEEATGRAVQDNDLVQVDYAGTVDGQPLEGLAPDAQGLGQGKDFWVAIGPHAFLPGFAEGLKGAKVGDTVKIDSTFEENFRVAALAGKTANYTATVKALRGPVLPEIDDEFLKRFAVTTREELEKRVRDDLEAGAKDAEDRRRRDVLAHHLLERTTMDLPATVVQRATEEHVYGLVREHARRGIPESAIVENKGRIFESASRTAADSVKLRYILHQIAEAEKIEVSAEDVDRHIAGLAARYGTTPEQAREQLKKRNAMDEMKEDLRSGKAMDLVLGAAQVA